MKKTTLLILILLLLTACTSDPSPDFPVLDKIEDSTIKNDYEQTDIYIDRVDILMMELFPIQISVIVYGQLANGCVTLDNISVTQIDNLYLLNFTTHRSGEICTQALVPFQQQVDVDIVGLLAGSYFINAGDITEEFILETDNFLLIE